MLSKALATPARMLVMADFEIRMLNDSEVGISALTERAQKDRRIAAGVTVKAAEKEGFTFKGKELIGL